MVFSTLLLTCLLGAVLASDSEQACPMNGFFGYGPKGYDHALGITKARISKPAPDFNAPAVLNGKFVDIKLSDYKGRSTFYAHKNIILCS